MSRETPLSADVDVLVDANVFFAIGKPSNPKYGRFRDAVAAIDIARRTIASETGQPEHEVEKADTILAGLAIQYVRDRSPAGVVVLTDDKPARSGIENAVRARGYTETITVSGLANVVGEDPGDSTRLI